MIKTLISISLTFLLGPGVGHIYIGKFKRGFAFIGATLLGGVLFVLEALKNGVKPPDTTEAAMQLIQEFYAASPKTVFFYDALFAALWAFAFVDVFFKSGGAELFKRGDDEVKP